MVCLTRQFHVSVEFVARGIMIDERCWGGGFGGLILTEVSNGRGVWKSMEASVEFKRKEINQHDQ